MAASFVTAPHGYVGTLTTEKLQSLNQLKQLTAHRMDEGAFQFERLAAQRLPPVGCRQSKPGLLDARACRALQPVRHDAPAAPGSFQCAGLGDVSLRTKSKRRS